MRGGGCQGASWREGLSPRAVGAEQEAAELAREARRLPCVPFRRNGEWTAGQSAEGRWPWGPCLPPRDAKERDRCTALPASLPADPRSIREVRTRSSETARVHLAHPIQSPP